MKGPIPSPHPPRSAHGSARTGKTHPLLGWFPLAVMTLAACLVLFTLTMARLNAGSDAALRAGASLVVRGSSAGALTTRTGRGGESAAAATLSDDRHAQDEGVRK